MGQVLSALAKVRSKSFFSNGLSGSDFEPFDPITPSSLYARCCWQLQVSCISDGNEHLMGQMVDGELNQPRTANISSGQTSLSADLLNATSNRRFYLKQTDSANKFILKGSRPPPLLPHHLPLLLSTPFLTYTKHLSRKSPPAATTATTATTATSATTPPHGPRPRP